MKKLLLIAVLITVAASLFADELTWEMWEMADQDSFALGFTIGMTAALTYAEGLLTALNPAEYSREYLAGYIDWVADEFADTTLEELRALMEQIFARYKDDEAVNVYDMSVAILRYTYGDRGGKE